MERARKSSGVFATHIGYLTNDKVIATQAWSDLSSFVKQHQLKPIVGSVFDFDQLTQAHTWVESRKNVGKTIVRLSMS